MIIFYLPIQIDVGLLGQSGWQLKHQVTQWLEEQIGSGSPASSAWFKDDAVLYQWYYLGPTYDNEYQTVRQFYFRTEDQALKFKQAWS